MRYNREQTRREDKKASKRLKLTNYLSENMKYDRIDQDHDLCEDRRRSVSVMRFEDLIFRIVDLESRIDALEVKNDL